MAQLEGLVAHYEELQEMMADPELLTILSGIWKSLKKKPICVK